MGPDDIGYGGGYAELLASDIAPATRARKAEGRQTSRKSQQTRKRIIEAAAAQCAAKGYSLTKLTEIADEVGIHLATLYYHYDTKEDLFSDVVAELAEQASRSLHDALESLPPQASPRSRLETAIRAFLDNILRPDALGRAHFQIVQQAPAEVRSRAQEITRRESETFHELFDDAARAGEIRPDVDLTMARMILFGAMTWSVEWFREGKRTADDFADDVIKVIFDGLSPRAKPGRPAAGKAKGGAA